MNDQVFKFCGEVIIRQKDCEELTIDRFNDDMVEVVRKYTDEHPDIRVRGTKISTKFIVKNFGYKNAKDAIEYFNEQTKK